MISKQNLFSVKL